MLEQTFPVAVTMQAWNHEHRAAWRRRQDYGVVVKLPGWDRWESHSEFEVEGLDHWRDQWTDGAEPLTRLFELLLTENRIRTAIPPPSSGVSVYGIRSRDEALVITGLIWECYSRNLEGTARAIAVLEGREDPVHLGVLPSSTLGNPPHV